MIKALNILVYVLFVVLIVAAVFNRRQARPFDFTPIRELSLQNDELATASRIFDARLAQYQLVASDIKTILYGMIIIGAISIFTTITRPKEFKLPFIDVQANAIWLRWACPAILTCLWLYFGFEFYSLIKSRVFLLDLGQAIEKSLNPTISNAAPLKYAIEDGGIGDFVFYLLSPAYTRDLIGTMFSWTILLGMYGTLFGIIHGSIMAGILSWIRVASFRPLALGYLFFTSFFLIGSHIVFGYQIPTLWPLDIHISIVGIVTFFFLPTTPGDSRTR